MVEYLELFKGDDTDFSLNQGICIKLVTDYDLAGLTAHVKFYDYEQTFYPIVDKKLPLSFPGTVTSKFPLGRGLAKIWLTEPNPDGSGTRRRTIANDLKIIVTNKIDLLSRKDISYSMVQVNAIKEVTNDIDNEEKRAAKTDEKMGAQATTSCADEAKKMIKDAISSLNPTTTTVNKLITSLQTIYS